MCMVLHDINSYSKTVFFIWLMKEVFGFYFYFKARQQLKPKVSKWLWRANEMYFLGETMKKNDSILFYFLSSLDGFNLTPFVHWCYHNLDDADNEIHFIFYSSNCFSLR